MVSAIILSISEYNWQNLPQTLDVMNYFYIESSWLRYGLVTN